MLEPNMFLSPIIRNALDPDFSNEETRQRIYFSNGREVRQTPPKALSFGWRSCVVNETAIVERDFPCQTKSPLVCDWTAKLKISSPPHPETLVLQYMNINNLSEIYQSWLEGRLAAICSVDSALNSLAVRSDEVIKTLDTESIERFGLSVGGTIQPSRFGLNAPLLIERVFKLTASDCDRKLWFDMATVLHPVPGDGRAILGALLQMEMESEMDRHVNETCAKIFSVDRLLSQSDMSDPRAKIEQSVETVARRYGRSATTERFTWANQPSFVTPPSLLISDKTGPCALSDRTTELVVTFSGTAVLNSHAQLFRFEDETQRKPAPSIQSALVTQFTKQMGDESLRSLFESRATISEKVQAAVNKSQFVTGYELSSLSFDTSIDNQARQEKVSVTLEPEPYPTSVGGCSVLIGASVEMFYGAAYERAKSTYVKPAEIADVVRQAIAETAAQFSPIQIALEWDVAAKSGNKAVRTLFERAIDNAMSRMSGRVAEVLLPERQATLVAFNRLSALLVSFEPRKVSLPRVKALVSFDVQLGQPRGAGWETLEEATLRRWIEDRFPNALQAAVSVAGRLDGNTHEFEKLLKDETEKALDRETIGLIDLGIRIPRLTLYPGEEAQLVIGPKPYPTNVAGCSTVISALIGFDYTEQAYNRSRYDPLWRKQVTAKIEDAIAQAVAQMSLEQIYQEWETSLHAGEGFKSATAQLKDAISLTLGTSEGAVTSVAITCQDRQEALARYQRLEHLILSFPNVDITLENVPTPLKITAKVKLGKSRSAAWNLFSRDLTELGIRETIALYIPISFRGSMLVLRSESGGGGSFMAALTDEFRRTLDEAVSETIPFRLEILELIIHPTKDVVIYYQGIQELKELEVRGQLSLCSQYLRTVQQLDVDRLEAIRTGNDVGVSDISTKLTSLRAEKETASSRLVELKGELNAARGVLGLLGGGAATSGHDSRLIAESDSSNPGNPR
jgi:hypothetical protein